MLRRRNQETVDEVPTREWNVARRKAAGVLAIVAATALSAGMSQLGQKPSWPYDEHVDHDYDIRTHDDNSAYIDKQADAIRLSDTFDGLINSDGFSLGYDLNRLRNSLKPNEVVTISQIGLNSRGDLQVSKKVETHPSMNDEDFNSEVQKDILNATPRVTSGLGEHFMSADPGRKYFKFGYGVDETIVDSNTMRLDAGRQAGALTDLSVHNANSIVRFMKYRLDSDGGVTVLDRQESRLTLIDNVFCGAGIPEKITSETKLTPEQNEVICRMLGKYGKFIPDTYRLLLDSVADDIWAEDSQNTGSKRIVLTYPYNSKEVVAPDSLDRTALHESFHSQYGTLDHDSLLFQNAQSAYDQITRTMKYRMPSRQETFISADTVGGVEDVWGAITESTYEGNESDAGHPWDNPTEMLSSTVAVLAAYPEQFLAKYAALDREQQDAISQAVNVVVGMIEQAGYKPADIIPQYELIKNQLETIS